ncbi:PAS domain S-box protein [Candidatus Bipolaricaulota bacterium]|nr:PAS domain S-box protein [Candidatus Bipolaricaulota bacterium]
MSFSTYETEELIEYLPEALFLEDFDGNILDVNAEARELLGYDKEELLDLTVDDLVPAGAPAFLPDQIDKATRSGDPMETVNLHKDGTEIPVEIRGRIIEVDGKERILVSVNDIGGRKVAEEKFRKLFDQGPEPAVLLDDNSRLMDVNSRFEEVFNYKLEEVKGKNVNDVIVPDRLREEARKLDEDAEQGYTNYETIRQGKNREFPVSISANPVSVSDETFVLGTYKDITERVGAKRDLQKSEKRLKWALEGTQAGLWDWNVQTGEVVFDERWAKIVGYTLEELQPVSIKTWRKLAHSEDLEKSEELLDKHFKGETDYYNCEVRMKHKSGEWVWVLDRGRIVEWDDEGEPIRMVGTHQDITERKEAEQALQEERDKLKNLHDTVDEMQQQDTKEDVLQTAVDVAETMLDFRFCDISLVEGDYLVPKASATSLDSEESVPFEMGEGITGKTMQKGETIWGEDLRDHPEAKPTNEDFRAFISVPIGELGVFQVISEEVASFSERDVELAEVLVGHLREELMRVQLEEELREQAIKDPLTDLYNRRYFNESLGKEVERCRRYDEALAFLMLDVDRFKEVNDRYTHQTGDKVLQEVADMLEDNVRDADTVVRYGGDEFLIMMPETKKVESTVDRIERELKRWNEESDLLDFPLTLAKGTSRWNPDQERDVEEALKEADKKMYEDKGR